MSPKNKKPAARAVFEIQPVVDLPAAFRKDPGRIDTVHGREKLPVWAQERLRQIELNYSLDGETVLVEDDDKLLLISPSQPDMVMVVHRYPRPLGGHDDSVEIRHTPVSDQD